VPSRLNFFSRLTPLVIAVLVVAGDRLSKLEIQHALSTFDSIPIIPGWLRIIRTENPGAAFGMLAEGNPVLRSLVLIGVSALVMLFVAWALWSRRSTLDSWLARLGLRSFWAAHSAIYMTAWCIRPSLILLRSTTAGGRSLLSMSPIALSRLAQFCCSSTFGGKTLKATAIAPV
jgi:signal peptidase (SPase) II